MDGSLVKGLTIMITLSILIGYYTMTILIPKNKTNNLNKIYLSILMALYMGEIMLFIEALMNKRVTKFMIGIALLLLVGIIILTQLIKKQIGINQKEYLKSMIEHHQMAIQMSEKLKEKPHDADVDTLLNNIMTSQGTEIEFMRKKLEKV